jgi:hypothetical protein
MARRRFSLLLAIVWGLMAIDQRQARIVSAA